MSVTTTQSPLRVLEETDDGPLGATCPVCGSEPPVEELRDRVEIPISTVSRPSIQSALESAGVATLTTQGATCREDHRRLTLLFPVESAHARGWDAHLGLPVDCGPQGQQIVPIHVDALPNAFLASAIRGLRQRGETA